MNDDLKSDHPHGWRSEGEVKPAGGYLTLNAEDARKYGLAQDVAANYEDLVRHRKASIPPEEVYADRRRLAQRPGRVSPGNPWTTCSSW